MISVKKTIDQIKVGDFVRYTPKNKTCNYYPGNYRVAYKTFDRIIVEYPGGWKWSQNIDALNIPGIDKILDPITEYWWVWEHQLAADEE
jgi:hypothetical protein